ncbi:MAG TPA: N-acetylmuramoyl-L-alanine amidase [Bacillota bacterium]|nr:N-acetylmuramoyl-L-alanine amidase [Bacillota bacterium]
MQFAISKTGTHVFLVILHVIFFSVCPWAVRASASGGEDMILKLSPCVALTSEADATGPGVTEHVTLLQVEASEKDGRTTVEISFSGNASSYKSFTLQDPLRLVLDIEGAILLGRPDPIPVNDGIIERVRVGQFNPSVVRVVFDLSRSTSYTVVQTEDRPDVIRVSFPKRVTGVEFFDRDGRGEAVISGTGALEYETSSLTCPHRIVVDLPGTVLVEDAISMPVSHPQVTQVRASQFTSDTVRVVLDLVKATTYSVFTSSDRPGEVIVDLGYRILGVDFTSSEKSTIVNVISSGNAEVKSMVLTAPNRIVMDFENSTLDTAEIVIPVGDSVVERIRLAQHRPMTVRVVLDLNYYIGHSAQSEESRRGAEVEVFKSPMWNKTIVIDPGHGGTDPGAIGSTGLQEKAVVLDISKRVATQLQAMGAEVILTRSDDITVSLPERVKITSNARADAFISIHANASRSGGPTGTETLFADTVPMSKVLAEHIQTALVSQIRQFDRGARERNDLMVIREVKCPACLVEVVFMSNLAEELLLLDPAFREKAARGIVNGTVSYFQWRKDRQKEASAPPEKQAQPEKEFQREHQSLPGSMLQQEDRSKDRAIQAAARTQLVEAN